MTIRSREHASRPPSHTIRLENTTEFVRTCAGELSEVQSWFLCFNTEIGWYL